MKRGVARAYQEKGFHHQVRAFISDMVWAYDQADMIISRAGAMTLTRNNGPGQTEFIDPFSLCGQ